MTETKEVVPTPEVAVPNPPLRDRDKRTQAEIDDRLDAAEAKRARKAAKRLAETTKSRDEEKAP